MTTLASNSFIKCGFEVEVSLLDLECGMSDFSNKWKRDDDGPIVTLGGDRWNCEYFTIGKLKDGFDATVQSAQNEFDRDCDAFDVSLVITVSKNGIELHADHVVGSEYNYIDETTPEALLEDLYNDYGELAEPQIIEAKKVLEGLFN